jgi:hypothetical protein
MSRRPVGHLRRYLAVPPILKKVACHKKFVTKADPQKVNSRQ